MTTVRTIKKTQLQRSREIREELKSFYPRLAELREGLSRILAEAQNDPPHGESDGSITETQYSQLRSIERTLSDALLAQLFDSVAKARRRR